MRVKIDVRSMFLLLALAVFLFESVRINTLQLHLDILMEEQDDNDLVASNIQQQQQQQQQHHHTILQSMPGMVVPSIDLLAKSNTSDYSWVGDHWIPPPGVPTYSPTDLLRYFRKRNVLFIGDSTSRRVWATAYAMMNATDRKDIPIRDLDIHAVVDFHKRTQPPYRQCKLDDRGARKETQRLQKIIFNQFECRDLPPLHDGIGDDDDGGESADNDGDDDAESKDFTTETKRGRFDFTFFTCYSQVDWFIRLGEDNDLFHKIIKPDYDLIIIGTGIWEIVNMRDCERNNPNVRYDQRLKNLLNTVHKISSPELQVMYRTCGFDARDIHYKNPRVAEFANIVHEFFQNITDDGFTSASKDPSTNLTLVDWAIPLAKRSFGEDRIEGDLPPHYGLQARSLFVQQLMHEMMKKEAQKLTGFN
mmetsp:Transcript_20732/g.31110  ORF Transcript_20732/g.31110 Transcript_20732/m.31110 type:complete len:419 (-) Transcript_20732:32-1288(-)